MSSLKFKIPQISIIMPTYNGEKTISRSIKSILSQTRKDFELIIIDDGSTDGTKEIIKNFSDKRIVYLRNKTNKGVSKARNKGLRKAKGKYIAYCDHDDSYYPAHLERMGRILDTQPKIGLVYADYIIKHNDKKSKETIFSPLFSKENELRNFIGNPLNIMHRSICLKKAGYFDESKTINEESCEDLDLWLRISDHFKFYHIPEILSEYHFHDSNRSFSVDFAKSFIYILEKRLKKQISDAARINYLNKCAMDAVIKLLTYKEINYAFVLSKDFNSRQNNYRSISCLGMCFLAQGNFVDAANYLLNALRKMPSIKTLPVLEEEKMIQLHLAKALLNLNQIDKAISSCTHALSLDKNDREVKKMLALLYLKKGAYNECLSLIKKYSDMHSHNLKGACLAFRKDYRKAALEFKQAAQISPPGSSALTSSLYNLGLTYAKMKDNKLARTQFKKVLEISPDHSDAKSALLRLRLRKVREINNPKVSVIICTYNRGHIISKAIKSVLQQTFRDFELIIIDDGSNDNTKTIIKSFRDKRILYLHKRRGKNSNAARARNFGLQYARGKYISYLDDDDLFYPDHLKALARALDSHPEAGLAYSDTMLIDFKNKVSRRVGEEFDKRKLEGDCFIFPCSVMHRNICLEKCGFFDENFRFHEDWDLWLRISDNFNVIHVPKISNKYIIHGANTTKVNNIHSTVKYLVEKRLGYLKKNGQLSNYAKECSFNVLRTLNACAEPIFSKALSDKLLKDSKNYQTIAGNGLCRFYTKDFHAAKAIFSLSLTKAPSFRLSDSWQKEVILLIKTYLAKTYFYLGQTKRAQDTARAILKTDPQHIEAKFELTKCYIKQKHFKKALNLLNSTKEYNETLFNLLGCCYAGLKQHKKAVQYFTLAAMRYPNSLIYRKNLEQILQAKDLLRKSHKPSPAS